MMTSALGSLPSYDFFAHDLVNFYFFELFLAVLKAILILDEESHIHMIFFIIPLNSFTFPFGSSSIFT